jgi:hypothetical protein
MPVKPQYLLRVYYIGIDDSLPCYLSGLLDVDYSERVYTVIGLPKPTTSC